jgi:hypothetical protein
LAERESTPEKHRKDEAALKYIIVLNWFGGQKIVSAATRERAMKLAEENSFGDGTSFELFESTGPNSTVTGSTIFEAPGEKVKLLKRGML